MYNDQTEIMWNLSKIYGETNRNLETSKVQILEHRVVFQLHYPTRDLQKRLATYVKVGIYNLQLK